MRHEQPFGVGHTLLQLRRAKARGGGADQRITGRGGFDGGDDSMLQVEPLRHAFLDIIGTRHRRGKRVVKGQLAFGAKRCHQHAGVGTAGVLDHFVDNAAGVRAGVMHRDVNPVQQETRDPTTADDTTANTGNLRDQFGHFRSLLSP